MPGGTYLALTYQMNSGKQKTYTFSYLSDSATDTKVKAFARAFLTAHSTNGILATGPEEEATDLVKAVVFTTMERPIML